MEHTDQTKHLLDAISLATVLASLVAWLPPIAALISIIWGCIRIYETDTVQRMLGKYRPRATDDWDKGQ
jgi:hypothetical protein